MSICVTTDVFCDAEGCQAWVEGVSGRTRSATRDARKNAHGWGWEFRNGRDLCPEHAAVSQEGPQP